MYTLFQNKYGNLSKCTVDAIERMEKVGQQHQEDSEQVSEQIASDFATWLRGLPKGETEDINNTSADYIMQLFAERVNDNHQHYSKIMIINPFKIIRFCLPICQFFQSGRRGYAKKDFNHARSWVVDWVRKKKLQV